MTLNILLISFLTPYNISSIKIQDATFKDITLDIKCVTSIAFLWDKFNKKITDPDNEFGIWMPLIFTEH